MEILPDVGATPQNDHTPVAFTHRQILLVLTGLVVGMVLFAIDGTIVNTALPTIVGELGGLAQLPWVTTLYLLTSTVAVPIYGKLSDIYGRQRLFQAAIAIFLVGSVLAGMSQTMVQLVVSRGIQGVGGGGLLSMAMAIIGEVISPRERGRYMGYLMPIFFVTSILGPPAGGFMVDQLSWRWIFFVNIPFGLLALGVTSRVLRVLPVRRVSHRVDVEGAALLVSAVSCLLLMTSWGGRTYPWSSTIVRGLGAAAVVLTAGFVAWERRAAEPVLPLRLFRDRGFAATTVVAFLMGSSMFGAVVFLPLYFQVVRGASATSSGLQTLPMTVALMSTVVVGGRLITRTGRYKPICVAGLASALVGMALVVATVRGDGWYLLAALAVLGVGIGLVLPVLTLAAQNAVPYRDLGVATSAVSFFQSLGGACGLAAFGAVLTTRFDQTLADRLPPGKTAVDSATVASSPEKLALLPSAIAAAVADAMSLAVQTVFMAGLPLMVGALVFGFALREVPLRNFAPAQEPVAT